MEVGHIVRGVNFLHSHRSACKALAVSQLCTGVLPKTRLVSGSDPLRGWDVSAAAASCPLLFKCRSALVFGYTGLQGTSDVAAVMLSSYAGSL